MITNIPVNELRKCSQWLGYFYNFYLPDKPFKGIRNKLGIILKVCDAALSGGIKEFDSEELNKSLATYYELLDEVEDYLAVIDEESLSYEDREIYINLQMLHSVLEKNTLVRTMRFLSSNAPLLSAMAPAVEVKTISEENEHKASSEDKAATEQENKEKTQESAETTAATYKSSLGYTADIPNYVKAFSELFGKLNNLGISLNDSDEYFDVRMAISNADEAISSAGDDAPEIINECGTKLIESFNIFRNTLKNQALNDLQINRIRILNEIEFIINLFRSGYEYSGGDGIYLRLVFKIYTSIFVTSINQKPGYTDAFLDADQLYKAAISLLVVRPIKQIHGKPLSPQDVQKLLSMPDEDTIKLITKALGDNPLKFCSCYSDLL